MTASNDNAPTLHLHARNVRGVREIETPLDGITLVAGRNGAGKSSLAQAIAAAVTGAPPLAGMRKADMHLLLRSGTATGMAVVSTPGGRATFGLPDGKVASEGRPPQASPFAAGITSIVDMPARQATEALAPYIDAEPTRDDLRAALPDLADEDFARVWGDIEATGWDGALANVKEDGARIKGRWEQVTGERYGLKKAASWMPSNWVHGLEETASTEALAEAVAAAQTAYAEAIQAAAVNGSERQRLDVLAGQRKARLDALAEAEAVWTAANDAETAAAKAMDDLPESAHPSEAGKPCPHCGGLVDIRAGALVAHVGTPPDPTREQEIKAAHAQASATWNTAKRAASEAADNVLAARLAVEESDKAAKRLADMPAQAETHVSAEDAQRALDHAVTCRDAWTKRQTASGLHEQVLKLAAIVAAVAPDGVRSTKMARALAAFNADLAVLCSVAKFPAVRLEHDLSTSYGDRPYMLLSESEQYRARAIVQAAMAVADDSALVIFDRADLLDKAGRNGLMGLARHLNIPAIVCMTADAREGLPDLAAKGMGRTIWLESGEIPAA